MTAQLLSSKLVIQEEAPSSRTIQGVATGIAACLGITAKGPVGVATLLTSFDQFLRIFGAEISQGFGASAVRGFFSGGGSLMYFTRVVHFSDINNPNAKTSVKGSLTLASGTTAATAARVTGSVVGPYALTPGDTIRVLRDAAGTAVATINGTAGVISSTGGAPYALVANQNLVVRINGAGPQTITFTGGMFVDIGAATDAEVAAAIGAVLVTATVAAIIGGGGGVSITSNRRGTSSSVEIVSGTAASELGFSVGINNGAGNVANIGAVQVAEIKTIVEAAVSGVTVTDVGGAVRITGTVTGGSGQIQVESASSADDELGLDNALHLGSSGTAAPTLRVDAKYDGVFASGLTVLIAAATSGISSEFNLSVLNNGVVLETFPNVTMLDTDPRYVETVVNAEDGSKWVEVEDLDLNPGPSGADAERPNNSPGSPPVPFGPMTGGNDGLVGLVDADFIGSTVSRTGLHSFDLVSEPDLLICPDRANLGVHSACLTYCSVTKNGKMFFIADPPAGLTPTGINSYVIGGLKNTTEHAAIYWPRVKVLNPNPGIFGNASMITIPPSGHIAGMFARIDGSRLGGVYLPPGGVERGQLPGVLALETNEVLVEAIRDLITPNLVNPITQLRGQAICVNDVLTLLAGGNFPTVAERRGVSYIERSIEEGIEFARLRNNDDVLRGAISRTVEAFLLIQMRVGAFRSSNPDTAFFVDCSEALNPPSEVFAGRVNTRIGLATQKPARFVIMSFSQDTRALDEELAAS